MANNEEKKDKEISEDTAGAKEESKAPRHRPTKKELEEKVEELEIKLETSEAQAREYLETLQRLKAEFDNYRKRMIKEQTTVIEMAGQGLAAKLLPVIDNLERAIDAAEAGAREGLLEGVKMVHAQLMETLEREGLESIDPKGHPFDPRECEAVNAILSNDHEDNTVIEVHQKGYRWKGKLIRPAMATVSRCQQD